jgi:hypothetical protein
LPASTAVSNLRRAICYQIKRKEKGKGVEAFFETKATRSPVDDSFKLAIAVHSSALLLLLRLRRSKPLLAVGAAAAAAAAAAVRVSQSPSQTSVGPGHQSSTIAD